MTKKRVQFNKVVTNQLPLYVQEDFPLIGEFLKSYYLGQEFQGAPLDLIQNIDSYIKLSNCGNTIDSTTLSSDLEIDSTTVQVANTSGFPENYGLIKINDEIITYQSKTSVSFVNCTRGFSGITSFRNSENPEDLVFSTSLADSHTNGSKVENLSVLFLQQFLNKIKSQILPGFQNRELTSPLNEQQFIQHSKDFYSTRGTDVSFKILFKALYGETVDIIKPKDYIISPSNANFRKTKDLIVESVSGNPFDLVNKTLYQDVFENIPKAYAPVSNVESVSVGLLTDRYYKISVDGSTIKKEGTNTELLYDNFSSHAKTKVIGNVGIGQTFLDVDSTIGFPNSGTLTFAYNDSTIGIVTYSSRTYNQFLDVIGIEKPILDKTEIDQNTFAYAAGAGTTDGIRVKIRSVLNELKIPDRTYGQKRGSRIKIISSGKVGNNPKQNNWIFNTSQSYEIESLVLIDPENNIFRLTTKDENILLAGDKLSLILFDGNSISGEFDVTAVYNSKTLTIKGPSISSPDKVQKVRRIITKVNSSFYPYLNKYSSSVQNTYIDEDRVLVASSSLPSFSNLRINPRNQKIIFSGRFSGGDETFKITDKFDHNFFNGDAVYYTPEKDENGNVLSSLFSEGLYFIRRVDENTVKFAKSRPNLYKEIYVRVGESFGQILITNNCLERYEFNSKIIQPQKLLREIANPVDDNKIYETQSGFTGILVNGVELLNYKSDDRVYYGSINSIDVVSGGKNYDVINPPILNISDPVGSGATGFCGVTGSFQDILITNPGFDYLEVPTVKISGGNGRGAVAEAKLRVIPHEVLFNADSSDNVGLGSEVSTIGFSTQHKFRNSERVSYKTFGNTAISGINTNSIYYVSVVDDYTVTLHKSFEDSAVGINTVSLEDYGSGRHAICSLNGKAILNNIQIVNPGEGYTNKKVVCSPIGINTAIDTISIENHGFETGEIVKYSFDQTPISGINTSDEYYVTKVDKNNFKLSLVGVGITNKDFYLKTGQYVELKTSGAGTHSFNYPDITVEIIGKVGLSSIANNTYKAQVEPVVRGSIITVNLKDNGVGYGVSNIINFDRSPEVTLLSGTSSELSAIVQNGEIVEVVVLSGGKQYNAPPKLVVMGDGEGANLIPVISDGKIIAVRINNGGFGYKQQTTIISVETPGTGAQFKVNLQSWRINQYKKNFSNISDDDTFITKSLNSSYELQCAYMYAPRSLRSSLNSIDQFGNPVYGKFDITKFNDVETNSVNHSPIIGWAYDGNPIYGPFGYSNKNGGSIIQLKSGYSLDLKPNRPPLSEFPEEFFVEDFTWADSTDESYLDENNGRFCVTPDYPNGVYAYFATFDLIASSDGLFKNFKKPSFPYLIGKNYKSKPNDFNFKIKSNQDEIDLNKTNWIRNVYPYGITKKNSSYEYINESYKYTNQDSIVRYVEKGTVDSIGIITGGKNYKVNDRVIFESDPTNGFDAKAKVSRILGVGVGTISVESLEISNVEFYPESERQILAISASAHNLKDSDFINISGLSTSSSSLFEGSYSVGVTTAELTLTKQLDYASTTGIVTFINVSGSIDSLQFPNIKENDILTLYGDFNYGQPFRQLSPQVGTAITSKALPSNAIRKNDADIYNWCWDKYDAFDVDGDGIVSVNDTTVLIRYYFGFSGDNLIHNIKFPNNATRNTSSSIRSFIGLHTMGGTAYHDVDGNGVIGPLSDILMVTRVFGSNEFKNPDDGGPATSQAANVENVKVLNIDSKSSRIKVLRTDANTYRFPPGTKIKNNSRRFTIRTGVQTNLTPSVNREYYFNPEESIGIGSDASTGIGITINISNPGAGQTQVFIPTRSIYIPNHGLLTGDELTYYPNYSNSEDSIGISTVGGGSSIALSSFSSLYVAKLSEDFIGISSVKVGLGTTGQFVGAAASTSHCGLLYFTGVGRGVNHSFRTNYPNVVTGTVTKNLVTVATASTHNLSNFDSVFIDVNPASTTSISVRYDNNHKKLIVNGLNFTSSSVDILNNTIYIQNHGLVSGQKVIHISDSSSGGLENEKEYFVHVVDKNKIKLTNIKYESLQKIPQVVDIKSSSFGTLYQVNPPVKAYKNSTLIFDVSHNSLSYIQSGVRYPAFKFVIYTDKNYLNEYQSLQKTSEFEVTRNGIIGVSTNASVTVKVNQGTPKVLYYRLLPLNVTDNPEINKRISIDESVDFNNQILIESSKYNGEYEIKVSSNNTFNYTLKSYPEADSYSTSNSVIKYTTSSQSASGAIDKILLNDKGKGYTKVPSIVRIASSNGTEAILEAYSNSIGRIKRTSIENIGFDYSSDLTLRPSVKIPQVLQIELLNGLNFVGLTSFGQPYPIPPKLVVIDSITNKIVPDIDIRFASSDWTKTPEKLEEQYSKPVIEIVKNTFSISNQVPKIIPVQNSNGIKVSNLSYNSSTGEVTATLKNSYSEAESFPISVNDRILVEGVSVGVGSTGTGYNSSNYDYQLFKVTKVFKNTGGIGIVTYSLSEYLNPGEYPGNFDSGNSSATIVPERFFPTFKPELKAQEFRKLDVVSDGVASGTVFEFDAKNKYLIVESSDEFHVGNLIRSNATGATGRIKNIFSFDSSYKTDYYSVVDNGWEYATGFLNDSSQRLHDNEYYQNFSYAIKSKVYYDKWNDIVSTLTHTAGFKKFSDLQVESTHTQSLVPEITPIVTAYISIDSEYDLNCVSDIDLAFENYLTNSEVAFSDEINFYSSILKDYDENISNRVLRIDDISSEFNSAGRQTPYNIVDGTSILESRATRYIAYVRDRLFTGERQVSIVNVLSDPARLITVLNQYGRVESQLDLGSFDYEIVENIGYLRFYPTKFRFNNYNVTFVSYDIEQILTDSETASGVLNLGISTGSTGSLVSIASSNVFVNSGVTETILRLSGINTTTSGTRSAKILTVIESNESQSVSEFNEINLIHDGTDVHVIDFGQLSLHTLSDPFSASGLGTFYPYLSGSDIVVDYKLSASSGVTTAKVSSVVVAISSESYTAENTGVGATNYLSNGIITAQDKSLPSSLPSTEQTIVSIPIDYEAAYCIVQISDIDNNKYQLSEVVVLWDSSNAYISEYGVVNTSGTDLGTINARIVGSNVELTFTRASTYNAKIKSLVHGIGIDVINIGSNIDLATASIKSNTSFYRGTEVDVKRDFNLSYKGYSIFKRVFDGSSSSVVDLENNTVFIPNHFFVSGEEVSYYPKTGIGTNNIGIAVTSVIGIGTTSKLPSSVFIIKVDESKIKFAASPENALKDIPVPINLTSVGIGTSHSIVSKKQNQKVLISLDNLVQSPIVATSVTSSLAAEAPITQDLIYFTGITSFFSGNLIKVDNEIMKIIGVGIGSTNAIQVARAEMGTVLAGHDTGAKITRISGNYNIVENIITFADPPPGRNPIGSITDPVPFRDWEGITTSSSFSGRVFMHSGAKNGTEEAYAKNYIFDDISQNFTASRNTYTLKSGGSDVVGIATNNAFILINNIVQGKGLNYDYTLSEVSGITSITFTGTPSAQSYDPNALSLPTGGIIVSVGSTMGFGYQPLVSAGGTAVVSIAGTISSVSIGNSGSGYRVGVQTVRVAVASSTVGTPNLQFIGTAVVSNGHIVSIAVTNPGSGFSQNNPPYVIIDAPLPYSNIPLIYSQSSLGGGGTQAKVDITVGQGSSVIAFSLVDLGYGYGVNHTLTIPSGGLTGIPTTSSANFREFQLEVQEVQTDLFSAWSIGELEVLDNFSSLFDGVRKAFPITRSGVPVSIQSKYGSLVKVEDVVVIFINDVLQVPGVSYTFKGGSTITFKEAPRKDDNLKFFFYKGTSGIDILPKEVTNVVQPGDTLTLNYRDSLNQKSFLQQDKRVITDINSSSSVDTNVYYGPGLIEDSEVLRAVTLCKQTEDLIIENKVITKDRESYEPSVFPTTNIITSLGIGSTTIYVENVRPFFFPQNEGENLEHQNKITIVSQQTKVAAAATAVVSAAGTITSIVISDGGVGYTTCQVVIDYPVGIGTTRATANPVISSDGIITNIQVVSPGVGYTNTNPPAVLISPPTTTQEIIGVSTYSGDSGIIVGVAFTNGFDVGIGTSVVSMDKMILDFHIPSNSHLRSSTITGVAVTVSGISTGDFFVINKSNFGISSGKERFSYGNDDSVIGISTNFVDGLYQVYESNILQTEVTGVGLTYVNRVTVRVSGAGQTNFSSTLDTFDLTTITFDKKSAIDLANENILVYTVLSYYGDFSWGKVNTSPRVGINTFTSYAKYGLVGINTSDYILRTNRLKFDNYTG